MIEFNFNQFLSLLNGKRDLTFNELTNIIILLIFRKRLYNAMLNDNDFNSDQRASES